MTKKSSSSKRLELSNFKLNTILSITQSINNNLPVDKLLAQFEKILKVDLNIGKLVVFSYHYEWKCILQSSVSNKTINNIDVDKILIPYTTITNVFATEYDELNIFDFIIPVFNHDKAIAYVLIGDIDEEQEGISPAIRHLNFIQTLTNIIIVAIENKYLFEENLKQEALKKELELASKMQSMLIPDQSILPNSDELKLAVYYLPHSEVGGDYYDIFNISDNECGFCIADVSGKGMAAALLMSNFQANIRALFNTNHSLTEIVTNLNQVVNESMKGEKFITLFVAKYNEKTKQLNYINAGHNRPILFDKNTKTISHLTDGCVGIGMLEEMPIINEGTINISKGSKLICYTDGVEELENEQDEPFDMEIINNLIQQKLDIKDIIKNIVDALNTHKGTKNFFDDVSIMGAEF